MSANTIVFIVIACGVSAIFALAGWILWRQFEFYEKRDEDDDANP